jgi:deoxyribonuclease-4
MPLLGAHMSIAGGLHLAVERIRQVGGEALQIFAKNQRQWKGPDLDAEAIARFGRAWAEAGRVPVAVHDTYLVNLASPDETVRQRSIEAFADELERTARLSIPYLVAHPGSYVKGTLEEGLSRFIHNLDRAIDLSQTGNVIVLIENTAGQGTQLGSRFEEIAHILKTSRHGSRLGVCFDTCHGFAAGYDFRTREAYRATFAHFHRTIGLEKLRFFHLNDSKKDLGSRVDRHEHIGKGKIGLDGFRYLLNDPQFRNHPMVLETPKENDLEQDKENLQVLKALMSKRVRKLDVHI